MKSLVERCGDIWKSIRQSPAKIPTQVAISTDHVDEGEKLGNAFRKDEHYFQVRINEMYLDYARKWFSNYDPMVFVVSEFTYDKEMKTVPLVVGPTMMEKYFKKKEEIPKGMVFSDTRVAGLHPYCGGRLNLSVVLCQLKRGDYIQKFVPMVEKACSVLPFSTELSTYLKIAEVVVDGIEEVLGSNNTKPLIGFRKDFDPDAGGLLKPGYFALINMDQKKLDSNKLWVSENRLYYGEGIKESEPFRYADYVLYSITQTDERSDEMMLPFYPQWERVIQEATVPRDEYWKNAKAYMSVVYQTMMLSPDLTPNHASKLYQKYLSRMKLLHENALESVRMGAQEKPKPTNLDAFRGEAVEILEL